MSKLCRNLPLKLSLLMLCAVLAGCGRKVIDVDGQRWFALSTSDFEALTKTDADVLRYLSEANFSLTECAK
jgi:hypothetical protein